MIRLFIAISGLLLCASSALAQPARPSVSVLDFGQTTLGKRAAEIVRAGLRSKGTLLIADADLSRSAAMGNGYNGSLNLTLTEARDLGAALATDFYIIGDSQTLRRSSSEKPVYYESYCSLFLVNSRSGRLLVWKRPSSEGAEATAVEETLSHYLETSELSHLLSVMIWRAHEDAQSERLSVVASAPPLIEEAPDDEKTAEAQGLRLPRPYKRLRPEYPETAARAEAEATVDVTVDVGADGELADVQVVRWAGFGLDEATVATVKQMHFFPAKKNGVAIPMRVLLRYNFRKPALTK